MIAKIKWMSQNNYHDCGVFTMLHMESYVGEAMTKWNCGLDIEGCVQQRQFLRLRIKYLTRILLHKCNVHLEKMNYMALEFEKKYSKEVIEKMIKNAIKNRTERYK